MEELSGPPVCERCGEIIALTEDPVPKNRRDGSIFYIHPKCNTPPGE